MNRLLASMYLCLLFVPTVVRAADAPQNAAQVSTGGVQVITPSTSTVSDAPKVIPSPIKFSESTVKEYLMIRDPFKEPGDRLQKIGQISDLEKYDTTDFKLIAVMTGPKKIRAMIKDSAGKVHTVAVNARVGKRKGYVRKITTASVIVREVYPNAIGEDEVYDTEIPLITSNTSGRR